jgi:hypothetical protein
MEKNKRRVSQFVSSSGSENSTHPISLEAIPTKRPQIDTLSESVPPPSLSFSSPYLTTSHFQRILETIYFSPKVDVATFGTI